MRPCQPRQGPVDMQPLACTLSDLLLLPFCSSVTGADACWQFLCVQWLWAVMQRHTADKCTFWCSAVGRCRAVPASLAIHPLAAALQLVVDENNDAKPGHKEIIMRFRWAASGQTLIASVSQAHVHVQAIHA